MDPQFTLFNIFYALMGLLFRQQGTVLQLLSRLFFSPAVSLLGIGIFIGAIWQMFLGVIIRDGIQKKFGRSLLLFMVYAIVLHTTTLSELNKPSAYHIFMLFAFLTVLMTYFGVNYLLGGMHSYAQVIGSLFI